MADAHLADAFKPTQTILNAIVRRLELESLVRRRGIVNIDNVHYCGDIPEATAVALMRANTPNWMSKTGAAFFSPATEEAHRPMIDDASAAVDSLGKPRPLAARFPNLTDQNIRSFHSITPHAITGPARLYRILAPSSRGMSDCWVSEEVFKALQRSENPKAAWRKFLAVWPDWNVNGQFVIYEIKAGETLNTWRGLASSQSKASLPGLHLEGGWEQILFNIERSNPYGDTVRYYKKPRRKSEKPLGKELSQSEVNALTMNMSTKQKEGFFKDYTTVREQINHPNILGPFTTGWGYTEFEGALASERIGLPALPGQLVNRGI